MHDQVSMSLTSLRSQRAGAKTHRGIVDDHDVAAAVAKNHHLHHHHHEAANNYMSLSQWHSMPPGPGVNQPAHVLRSEHKSESESVHILKSKFVSESESNVAQYSNMYQRSKHELKSLKAEAASTMKALHEFATKVCMHACMYVFICMCMCIFVLVHTST